MDIPWNDAIVGPWIGGRLVEGQGTLVEDFSPSTGQLLGRLRLASAEQVDEAVTLAKQAQQEWARKPIRDRAEIVERLAQRVFDNADLLGEVDSQDTGSPVFPMQETARKGARYMKALAGSALEMQGRTIPASASGWHLTKLEPWGVIGGITAYNHPTHYSCLKSAPALIAGNAVVIKPSEQAPLSTLLFAQLSADLLPPGLLGILPGDATAGSALVAHRDVPRISFTGSLRTAAAIQQTVAATGLIKSLAFELGGKNPIVVCPDVDIDEVARAIVRGMNYMRVQGQSCGSTSRLLIHSDIKDRVVTKVVELVEDIRVGLPSAPDTQMGSLISLEHRDRVIAMIDDAVADGAVVLTGGQKCTEDELAAGAFMTPAVLDNVLPGTRMWREEVFGPVLGIHTWQHEAEAVELANDTEYGLTASVWSRDIDRALRIADAIDTGYVWVNDVETRYTGVPFGGWKQSGIGTEQGIVGDLLQCVRLKSINVAVRERATQA